MDDRELLEMAAKAAAIGGGWGDKIEYHNGAVDLRDVWILEGDGFVPWNPLIDDGDALRLAFALGMSVDAGACMIDYAVPDADDEELETLETLDFEHGGDIANLRRAIVRAAAEIGRAM
ncbi:hypothetical protein IM687_13995 [Stutzerimonas stutzeri]|uniref:hypothetical protein n=1 Tax=Stutzerimonas stutzeri TaxID=316 RepID=UPI0018AC8B5B|nr:hypothetical protein [Stutzerimonas stutzeri]QPI08306.1 hypothetical protein IM687_13995 [Stutzerimonas stutzeri]